MHRGHAVPRKLNLDTRSAHAKKASNASHNNFWQRKDTYGRLSDLSIPEVRVDTDKCSSVVFVRVETQKAS